MFRRALAPTLIIRAPLTQALRHIAAPAGDSSRRDRLCTQVSSSLLMIQPTNFSCNPLTRGDNTFQDPSFKPEEQPQQKALSEFQSLVTTLRSHHIDVKVHTDTPDPVKPDAVFPNNWMSSHPGEVVLYPMRAENRRLERRMDILEEVRKPGNKKLIDLTGYESEGKFLEGTGSLVLDRVNKKAYACLSPRTDQSLVQEFCSRMSYSSIIFSASYKQVPFYHTNVVMAVGLDFAVVCLESIDSSSDRDQLVASLAEDGKEVIEISEHECGKMLGNCLQVRNKRGELFIVMSETARAAMRAELKSNLEKHGDIISSDIGTIEALGGGSARCMILELF